MALRLSRPRDTWRTAGKADLLDFVRSFAPDFRLQHVMHEGKRGAAAIFTYRGETLQLAHLATEERPDPIDTIARHAAWLIQTRLGVPVSMPEGERMRMERDVLDAAWRGDTDTADRLGRELVIMNEGLAPVRMSSPFESFGGFRKHESCLFG